VRSRKIHNCCGMRRTGSAAALFALFVVGAVARAQPVACTDQIDTIEQQLNDPDQNVANQAALCIGENPGTHSAAVRALTDVIDRPDVSPTVKEASAWAAGRIAENKRVDADLAEDLAKELIPLVQDPQQSTSFRKACAYTLGRLSESLPDAAGPNGQTISGQSVSALSQILIDRSDLWASRDHLLFLSTAAEAVGRFRHQGQLAIPEIIRFLRDSRDALENEKGLTKEQTDSILRVQSVMADTLGTLPSDAASTNSGVALLELLKQDDTATLQSAIYALGNLGPRPEIQDGALLIIKQLHSGDSAIRQVSAYALGRIHPAKYHVEALEALAPALTDPAPRVREAASQAIEQFDAKDSFATLPKFTAAIAVEDNSNVRTSLVRNLSSIAQKEVTAVDPRNRKSAMTLLSQTEAGLELTLSSLKKSDTSYGPVLNAIDEVKQSERSIRGSWLRNRFTSHPGIASCIAVYSIWVGLCLVLFRWWPLKVLSWNEALRNAVDLDIPLPFGLGHLKIPTRYALFIGLLNDRSRVLDAWVDRYAGSVRQSLLQRQTVQERQIYVPLPVSIRTSHTTKVSALKPADLHDTCDQERWCIRILGEGGSGKTSLACQLAFWCLSCESDQRICTRHRSVPVLLEPGNLIPVETGTACLSDVIRSQLQVAARLPEPLEPRLFEMLIKTRRIVVIMDGVSEMKVFTKCHGPRLEESFPACALIVTARSTDPFGEGGYVDILPQRIDSDHLIPFMNTYLAHLNVRIDDSGLYEACRRLSIMVGKERGITPLLAQMFARTFVQIPDVRSSSPPPTCVPELMFTYVEVLNRAGEEDRWGDIDVLRASKRLAWECIRDTYRPGRGNKEEVVYGKILDPVSMELFTYLEHRLRLVDTIAGASFRFVLDPLAEYFGAIYVLEQYRADETLWKRFLESVDRASSSGKETLGFLLALNDSLEWKGISLQVPRSIVKRISERLSQARSDA
jgi:HEAT repeat protein